MGKIISVRINKNLEEIIRRYSEERKEEQSDVIRDLINRTTSSWAINKILFNQRFNGFYY